jgi:2-dehydro-3-deoxyglucarate aldolase
MKNHLSGALANGDVVLGAQLRLGTPAIAELFAAAGFDFVVIDGEHAPQTPVGIQAQLQAVNGYSCTPIVRLGRSDPDEIRLMLDMGAGGVLIPLLQTADDARKLVRSCRYPPEGTRSYGPSRAYQYGFDQEYYPKSTPDLVTMIIVETAEAIENIDEILAVDGLDTYVMGPADLSVALGVPMQLQHPTVQAAAEKVQRAAEKAGKPAGASLYPYTRAAAKLLIESGYRVLLVPGDEWLLQAICAEIVGGVDELRAELGRLPARP